MCSIFSCINGKGLELIQQKGVKVAVCRASFFVRGEIKHKQRMRGGPSLKKAEHIAQ